MERPAFAGLSQPTSRLVSDPAVATIEGASGVAGLPLESVSVSETVSPAVQSSPELFHLLLLGSETSAASKAKDVPSTLSVRSCAAVSRSW